MLSYVVLGWFLSTLIISSREGAKRQFFFQFLVAASRSQCLLKPVHAMQQLVGPKCGDNPFFFDFFD